MRSLAGDWRKAFEWFLTHYAFERQGRSPHYSTAAVKALGLYDGKFRGEDFEERIWQDFLLRGGYSSDAVGANPKNSPLYPANSMCDSVTGFITSLEEYDFNLVKWASALAKSGDIEIAWHKLDSIRGIANKIAALFLRDVVDAFEIDENKVGKKVYLHPIDVWTKRGANALAEFSSKKPKSYWECADLLIEVSEYANVRSTLTNCGLWFLGAQLVHDPIQFHNLLLSVEELRKFAARQMEQYRDRANILEKILGTTEEFKQLNDSTSPKSEKY